MDSEQKIYEPLHVSNSPLLLARRGHEKARPDQGLLIQPCRWNDRIYEAETGLLLTHTTSL